MADTPASIARRHDLDALRAIAMLLGIVLHGALSFIPGIGAFWGVQDSQAHSGFAVLLAAIHGWRMPLFFIVSGFFTAMLWRKRGLRALLWHRFQRIFLPLVLGTVTIIPLTWIVTIYVKSQRTLPIEMVREQAAALSPGGQLDVWGATAFNDLETLEHHVENGTELNALNADGSAPLHIAAFFGYDEAAEMLIDAGANPFLKNGRGETPQELIHIDWGTTKFIAGMFQIPLERERVEAGRERIGEMFEQLDQHAYAQKSEPISAHSSGKSTFSISGVLEALMKIPLFGHLWFLWFLCWLVVGYAIVVTCGTQWNVAAPPNWAIVSNWRYLWLVPLTAIPQFFMGEMGNEFGPDTSIGLLPIPSVLTYYAIFFGFGALYFDAQDQDVRVGRGWQWILPISLIVLFPMGLVMGDPETGLELTGVTKLGFALVQVSYAWLVSFGLMGLFHRFSRGESKVMRYLSDSSYWLYLAHIPLIIYIQFLVADWTAPAVLKFGFVCVSTSALLLISYQYCVRYTPIGTLLNGPRHKQLQSKIPPVDANSNSDDAQLDDVVLIES